MTSDTPSPDGDPEWVPRDLDFGTEETWARHHDCYGPSTSTPRTLKRLFSPELEERKSGVSWLYAALFHQGGRFEATVAAAPLIIDMAVHPALPAWSRRFLCEYIAALAYGYTEELPWRGVNPMQRQTLLELATEEPIWRRRDTAGLRIEPYCDTWTARDLYRVIQERRERLYPLIEDEDAAVAAAARAALTLLAADDQTFQARMEALLTAAGGELAAGHQPADPEPVVCLLIGVATIARAMDAPKPDALLTPWLAADAFRLRFAAAIALAEPETINAYRQPLIDGLIAPAKRGQRAGLDQVWTSLESLAMALVYEGLSAAPDADKAVWLDSFAANLSAPDIDRALNAAQLILKLLAPSQKQLFKGCPAAALTPLQRRGLEAIRDHGLWSLGEGGMFLNFSNIIRAFGLPETRDGFAAYLAESE